MIKVGLLMGKKIFFACSLVLFIFVGLDKQFSRAGLTQESEPRAMTGWLTVVWGSSVLNGENRVAPIYYLTTESGQSIQLLFSEELLHSLTDIASLNGQLLKIEGYYANDDSNSHNKPLVFQVELVRKIWIDTNEMKQSANLALSDSRPWITLLCRFPDIEGEQKSPAYFEGLMANKYPGLDHYWRELSYDNINLIGSATVSHWYDLPYPKAHYISDEQTGVNYFGLLDDCVSVADNEVYFPDYYGIILMFNDSLDGQTARGATGVHRNFDGVEKSYGVTWMPPGYGQSQCVIAHEMGHGFDLPHSQSEYDVMNVTGSCGSSDPIYGRIGKHTIAYHKDKLGWLSENKKYIVESSESITFTLSRRALPQSDNPIMIEIPIEPSGEYFFTLELLKTAGYDRAGFKTEGILIHEVHENRDVPAQFMEFFPVGAKIFTETLHQVMICQKPLNEAETQIHITSELDAFCSTSPDLSASRLYMQPIVKGTEGYVVNVELLNMGPSAYDVIATIPFQTHTVYITGSANTTQGTTTFEDSTIYYNIGTLLFNTSVNFSFGVEVKSGIAPAGTYTNTVAITWENGGFPLNYVYNIKSYTYLPLIMR